MHLRSLCVHTLNVIATFHVASEMNTLVGATAPALQNPNACVLTAFSPNLKKGSAMAIQEFTSHPHPPCRGLLGQLLEDRQEGGDGC